MKPSPITPKQRAEVLRLARTGMSRNGVARATGVSATSVSRIAAAAGVTFDRVEQTELATATRAADQRADRVEQAQGLLDDLAAGRGRLATAERVRDWTEAARGVFALAQAHARLAEVEQRLAPPADTHLDQSKSLLGTLMSDMRAWRAANDDDDQDDDDQEGATP